MVFHNDDICHVFNGGTQILRNIASIVVTLYVLAQTVVLGSIYGLWSKTQTQFNQSIRGCIHPTNIVYPAIESDNNLDSTTTIASSVRLITYKTKI